MSATSHLRGSYFRALREPGVWIRAVKLGFVVGLVQVALNQGDYWLQGAVTRRLVLKSACSVLFAISVVLLASASTRAEALRSSSPS